MDYEIFIHYKKNICHSNLSLIEKINIVYCFDDNYSLGSGVSLISLLENNKNILVHAHLFVIKLSEKNENNFIKIAENYSNLSLTIYHVNDKFDVSEQNKVSFPLSASLRIIVPEILKNTVENFLYIDSDTLVTGKLNELIDSNNEKIILAIEDYDAKRHIKRLNIPTLNYFNSGVLLINTSEWIKNRTTSKVLDLLMTNEYKFPDQDALNIVLYNACHYLPSKYNSQFELSYLKNIKLDEESIITHYLGQDKPWFSIFTPSVYQKYLNLSPWQNTKLRIAPNSRRIRIYSKRIIKTNTLKSLILYIKYLYYKYNFGQLK